MQWKEGCYIYGMQWKEGYYIDGMLLHSLRSAQNISMTVADALEYCITHYLQLFAVILSAAECGSRWQCQRVHGICTSEAMLRY